MSKRVFWRKGMRLTDEILTLADSCTSQLVGNAMALGAVGRYGLFPNVRPFSLSADINKNIIDIVSLNCLAVTRDGSLIDIIYDTNYTSSFDTRAIIPAEDEDKTYILCVSATDEWKDTADGMCQSVYSFSVQDSNTPVAPNAMPIARIVFEEFAWRVDDINFVPPCLYVNSHPWFLNAADKFRQSLRQLNMLARKNLHTTTNDAFKIFWPAVRNLYIEMDKETELMTPMMLMSSIQKCVNSFLCACTIDEEIEEISDQDKFEAYVMSPYNYQDAYQKVMEGLNLCYAICRKVEAFQASEPVVPKPVVTPKVKLPAPALTDKQLKQHTSKNMVKITVDNVVDGATLYYSTDGSDPSNEANGKDMILRTHFNNKRVAQPDETINLAMKMGINNSFGPVAKYTITVTKDWKYIIEV